MSPKDGAALMNSIARGAAGGVCIGAGIAIGAYSGGWFLVLAVLVAVLGIGVLVGAFARSVTASPEGDAIPVKLDLIDRSAPSLAVASTLIAGEARPPGDAPFRFHIDANLSRAQLAEIVHDGSGELPAGALGEPGAAPVTEHRVMRVHAPAALAAAAAMWATMLLPPSDLWDLKPLTASVSSALPGVAAGPDARPLWEWYDKALAHLRAESPESLNSLLSLAIRDTYVDVTVYLGGDRMKAYEGRTRGWESSEATTNLRSRDTFTAGDLGQFSARDFLSGAAAMLPPDNNELSRLELSRGEDIFGAERPILAEAWFGNPSITVSGTVDGIIAPWWPADDIAAGLQQAGNALAARGVPADSLEVKEIRLDGGTEGGFRLEYYRGAIYYRTGASAGEFTNPDENGSNSEFPRFRFSDVSPDVVAAVRDDAMRRFDVDPVDRGNADIAIAAWGSDGGERRDDIVITVDYPGAYGGTAVYALSGEYLAESN